MLQTRRKAHCSIDVSLFHKPATIVNRLHPSVLAFFLHGPEAQRSVVRDQLLSDLDCAGDTTEMDKNSLPKPEPKSLRLASQDLGGIPRERGRDRVMFLQLASECGLERRTQRATAVKQTACWLGVLVLGANSTDAALSDVTVALLVSAQDVRCVQQRPNFQETV